MRRRCGEGAHFRGRRITSEEAGPPPPPPPPLLEAVGGAAGRPGGAAEVGRPGGGAGRPAAGVGSALVGAGRGWTVGERCGSGSGAGWRLTGATGRPGPAFTFTRRPMNGSDCLIIRVLPDRQKQNTRQSWITDKNIHIITQ